MSIFNRKSKHKHQWELIDSQLFVRSYGVQRIFRKTERMDIEGIAKLYKCIECGEEKATTWSEMFRDENHMDIYMMGGWGEIDPSYYRLKFLQKEGTNEK